MLACHHCPAQRHPLAQGDAQGHAQGHRMRMRKMIRRAREKKMKTLESNYLSMDNIRNRYQEQNKDCDKNLIGFSLLSYVQRSQLHMI